MPPLARTILITLFMLGTLHAETQYAKPLQDFQVGYPIEPYTLKLYTGSRVKLERKTNDAVFITKNGDPTILKVDRYGSSQKPRFSHVGNELEPLELIHAPVDQGWALFSSNKAYPIIEQTETDILLELPKAGAPLRTKLPIAYFKIYTMQELNQELQERQARAEDARIAAEIARMNRQLAPQRQYRQPVTSQLTSPRQSTTTGRSTSSSNTHTRPSYSYSSNSDTNSIRRSIDYFVDKEKTQFQIIGDTALCLAVCDGNRDTRTLQLVFSYRPNQGSIRVECYMDGAPRGDYVYAVANGRTINVTGAMSLKDFTHMAKAYRREIHLGPRDEWIDSYQMIGDRPLHQFIDYVEDL